MTSAGRLITTSGGIINSGGNNSSEGQNFDDIDTNVQSVSDNESHNSPRFLDKITIKYYGTIPPLIITKEHKVTNVADILKSSRQHLRSKFTTMFPGAQGLYYFNAPLFGLIDERHKYWLVSTDTLTSKTPTYYYRFQFCLPPEENNCHKLFKFKSQDIDQDKFFCEYFFTQCRDDFINNRIPALYTEEKVSEMLGFVSVDYQIPKSSYDYKHVTNQESESPSEHNPLRCYKFISQWKRLPKKCRKQFYSPYSYFSLYTTMREDLQKKGTTRIDTAHILQRDYVINLYKSASEYCMDNYSGIPFNEGEKSMIIQIQPYKEPSGVYYDDKFAFAINDILDIEHEKEHSINGVKLRVTLVFSSRSAEVIKFDYLDGLSFVYKLLGYHRIMVNYHIHIKDLDCFSSSKSHILRDLHSFGPMAIHDVHSLMYEKLNNFKKTNMGITSVYLIAQDMAEDKMVLHICNIYDQKQSYPIRRRDDCYYVKQTDETKFQNKEQLFKYLGEKFGRQIKPDIYNGNVWIKKIFSREQRTKDRSEIAKDSDLGPRFFSSDQYTIEPEEAEKDGDLCVDIIKVRQSASRETVMSMIQLKSSIPLPNKPATDDLVELCETLHKIKNSTFVKFFGVSKNLPYRVFVDCSPHGSLSSIIRNKFRNPYQASTSETDVSDMEEITLLQFVTTVTTVCRGLEYLLQKNLHHGNIKCSNVFVYGLTNVQFDVKIGHPGLVKFYNKQPLTDVINTVRIPWIGVELFDNFSRCSIESEIYSFSTFVWEFLSYGKNPAEELNELNVKNAKAWIHFFKEGQKMRRPPTLDPGDFDFEFKITIKEQIWELMCECWSVKPEDRPNVTDIIRRLMNMYSEYGTVDEREINIESLKQTKLPKKSLCNVILAKQIKSGETLGKGHYGEVRRARYYPDPSNHNDYEEVAVKLTHDSSTDTPLDREKKRKLFEEEIKTMEKAQHKNVIKIIGVCYKGESQTVVMELVKKGDLANWLKKSKKEGLNDPYPIYHKFVEEIAEGMAYLSSEAIIHRDLAARNILITEDEHIKISDFGLAKRLEDNHYYKIKSETQLPQYWTAPECFCRDKKVTLKADVWSFGVVLWEIYSGGASPILDKTEHIKLVLSGHRLPKSSNWPNYIQVLMDKCWKLAPEERPTFAEIVQELKETSI